MRRIKAKQSYLWFSFPVCEHCCFISRQHVLNIILTLIAIIPLCNEIRALWTLISERFLFPSDTFWTPPDLWVRVHPEVWVYPYPEHGRCSHEHRQTQDMQKKTSKLTQIMEKDISLPEKPRSHFSFKTSATHSSLLISPSGRFRELFKWRRNFVR